jgi:hypothetical protein
MRSIITRPLIVVLLFYAGATVAGVQARGGAAGIACQSVLQPGSSNAQSATPGGNGTAPPQQQRSLGPNGSLGPSSRNPGRSSGVIQPPPTGDQGVIAPPDQGAGRTPVIPPPGTPGGNPSVQPK